VITGEAEERVKKDPKYYEQTRNRTFPFTCTHLVKGNPYPEICAQRNVGDGRFLLSYNHPPSSFSKLGTLTSKPKPSSILIVFVTVATSRIITQRRVKGLERDLSVSVSHAINWFATELPQTNKYLEALHTYQTICRSSLLCSIAYRPSIPGPPLLLSRPRPYLAVCRSFSPGRCPPTSDLPNRRARTTPWHPILPSPGVLLSIIHSLL
jgi:hypothetical protein